MVKAFQCTQCKKRFSSQKGVYDHMGAKHIIFEEQSHCQSKGTKHMIVKEDRRSKKLDHLKERYLLKGSHSLATQSFQQKLQDALSTSSRCITRFNIQRSQFVVKKYEFKNASVKERAQIRQLELCYTTPPFSIAFLQEFGYFTYATKNIENNTIICEYCGEFGFSNDIQYKEEVLSFGRVAKGMPKKEVVIVSDKYANEGRFFLGASPSWKDKTNCQFKCLLVNNILRCFIETVKYIQKEDILYLYYGQEYDQVASEFKYLKSFNDVHQKIHTEYKQEQLFIVSEQQNQNYSAVAADMIQALNSSKDQITDDSKEHQSRRLPFRYKKFEQGSNGKKQIKDCYQWKSYAKNITCDYCQNTLLTLSAKISHSKFCQLNPNNNPLKSNSTQNPIKTDNENNKKQDQFFVVLDNKILCEKDTTTTTKQREKQLNQEGKKQDSDEYMLFDKIYSPKTPCVVTGNCQREISSFNNKCKTSKEHHHLAVQQFSTNENKQYHPNTLGNFNLQLFDNHDKELREGNQKTDEINSCDYYNTDIKPQQDEQQQHQDNGTASQVINILKEDVFTEYLFNTQ